MFLAGHNFFHGIVPDFKVERYQFTVNKYQRCSQGIVLSKALV